MVWSQHTAVDVSQAGIGQREPRIALDGLIEKAHGALKLFGIVGAAPDVAALEVKIVRASVLGGMRGAARQFVISLLDIERGGEFTEDLIFEREQIAAHAGEILMQNCAALICGIVQAHRDGDGIVRARGHGPAQEHFHAQRAGELLGILLLGAAFTALAGATYTFLRPRAWRRASPQCHRRYTWCCLRRR